MGVIVSDTFRRDHLGCYGNEWIRTERLDRSVEFFESLGMPPELIESRRRFPD